MIIEIQQKNCIINDKEYPIILEFTVTHPKWKLDHVGYIIDYEYKPRLVLSDNGKFKLLDVDAEQILSIELYKTLYMLAG